jgi:hypothetical protein
MKTFTCIVLLLLASWSASAHHSNAEYDRTQVVELDGIIARVIWRNPHVGLELDVSNADGTTTRWVMGAADLAGTLRRGVPEGTFQVGQRVTVAGFASTRRAANMLVTNVLLPDRREILLTGFSERRWNTTTVGGGSWVLAADVGEVGADDIFRVWTLERARRPEFADNPPLTDFARTGWAAYEDTFDPALQCAPLGMPRVITQTGPHPIAFERRGDDILLRGEYFDVERLIHMGEERISPTAPLSPQGYSIGRWEDDVLVVETSRINYPFFDIAGLAGIPQTESVFITERYYLNEDGTELHMDFYASDTGTFTEAIAIEDYATWKWRPEIQIQPYQCEVD